ncbi:MAG: hypothetical protein AB8G18_15465 [Gammaproteobacteria bacterium]
MSPKPLLAILALALLVAAAGYFHFQSDVSEVPLVTDMPILPTAPVAPTVDPDPAPEPEVRYLSSDKDELPEGYALDITGKPVEYKMAFGRKVKKNSNCTHTIDRYITNEDGTTSPVYNCVPNEPKPLDIYSTYSNEELEALAYSDSRAAFNLALRLRDTDYPQALQYSLRSAALSGDIKGLALMSVHIPHSAKKNGKWNLDYFEEKVVLSAVARTVDSNSKMKGYIPREAVEQPGVSFDPELIKARIAEHVRTIEKIRNEVGID